MNQFINAMSTNNSVTFNGMPTNQNSGNSVLDLFFLIGATRTMPENDILSLFDKSYSYDPKSSLRILYYARDIDKGLGERRVFRLVMQWLMTRKKALTSLLQEQNITSNIIRVDDIVFLANEMVKSKNLYQAELKQVISFLFEMLGNKKVGGIVAKWMPRKNSQYGAVVRYMRTNGFIPSYTTYRKEIVSKTNVVEQQMSFGDWENINLEHVPSIAMKKYKKAFKSHSILQPYIEKVVAGEAKINAKRLYPYDIAKEVIKHVSGYSHIRMGKTDRDLLNEQWKNLKGLDDLPKTYRAIPIIDTSGSMLMGNMLPISIAVGLGLFLAERNPNETFRNSFITFSNQPAFQQIIGHDIVEKISNTLKASWAMNTDLEAVFDLVLRKALQNNVSPDEMPTHLVIISDMEFDQCNRNPDWNAIQMIKNKYRNAGYDVPTIVFWNVNGRIGNLPARMNENNVLLVSGASQNVINFILKKGYEDLMSLIKEVIDSPRYEHIVG